MNDNNLLYRFHTVSSEEFKNGTPIDNDIYFITDTHEIYRGSINYTNNIILYTGTDPVYQGGNKLYINIDTFEVKIYKNNEWCTLNKYSKLEGKPGDEFEYEGEINIISIDPNGELSDMFGLYAFNYDTSTIYDISEGDSLLLYIETSNGEKINIGTGVVYCDPETDTAVGMSQYQQGHYCLINSSSDSVIDCVTNGLIPILDESKNYAFAVVYAKSSNHEICNSTINISSSQDFSDIIIEINKNATIKGNIKLPNSALSFDSAPTEGSDNLLSSDAIYKALKEYVDAIPTHLSDLEQDSNYRTVSDNEKNTWNAKSNFDGSYSSLNNVPEKFTPTDHSHNIDDVNDLSNTISDITNIASGKCASFVFDTVNDLDLWLSEASNTEGLKIGDIFLIIDVGVPDYWWDGNTKQILETTKIDLSSYATKGHTHTAGAIDGLASVATSGSYKDLSNIPIISNKASTGSDTTVWYFPLASMVIDDSSNYGNLVLNGRFGGWEDSNTATFQIMLMNRSAARDGNTIMATVSASGYVDSALPLCDIIIQRNDDGSDTVYLKCTNYFLFNFEYAEFQHYIIYDGSYVTEEPTNIVWRLSEAPKTVVSPTGVFSASGGIEGLDEKIAEIIDRMTTEIESL